MAVIGVYQSDELESKDKGRHVTSFKKKSRGCVLERVLVAPILTMVGKTMFRSTSHAWSTFALPRIIFSAGVRSASRTETNHRPTPPNRLALNLGRGRGTEQIRSRSWGKKAACEVESNLFHVDPLGLPLFSYLS